MGTLLEEMLQLQMRVTASSLERNLLLLLLEAAAGGALWTCSSRLPTRPQHCGSRLGLILQLQQRGTLLWAAQGLQQLESQAAAGGLWI